MSSWSRRSNPLSLTTDKSTEAYRNWWPGPTAMTAYMNRSIDLLEEHRARDRKPHQHEPARLPVRLRRCRQGALLHDMASAEAHGAGPVRIHDGADELPRPSPERGFDSPLTGADIITDPSLIRRHFPTRARDQASSRTRAAPAGSAPSSSA